MTSSQAAQRAARRRGELHHGRGDAPVRQVVAARYRLDTVRLAMTLRRRPVMGGDVRTRAIERLHVAVDDLQRLGEESDAAEGRFDERTAAVALAAANEQLAAREAWVKYIEHGH
jgi:hypothetical protein